jgi:hypothetical protein
MSNASADEWYLAEYQQLREDHRHFASLGWQATVAALAVDGLIVGSILDKPSKPWYGFLPLMASILTFLMAWTTLKWIQRSHQRVRFIQHFQVMRGLQTFQKENALLAAPVGYALFILMILTVAGLAIYSAALFLQLPF